MRSSSAKEYSSRLVFWITGGLMLLAIAVPVVGLQRWSSRAVVEEPALDPVVPKDPSQKVKVVALGRVEPISGVLKVGAPINEIVGRLMVKEGDWVDQGATIAYTKSHQERRIELEKAREDLRLAHSRLEAETGLSEAQVQERKIDAIQVPLIQEREITAQEALIQELHLEKDLAEIELERYQSLVEQDVAPRRDLENRQSRVDQLSQRIAQAQETLKKIISARDRELANIQAQVNTAEVNTDRIRASSDVEVAQRSIKLAQVRLENTRITAPQAGRVLRIVTKAGETIGDNGQGQGILIELADTRTMQIVAEVNESDINQVRIGQRAKIVSRNQAFSQELTGVVRELGQQIFKNNVLSDDPSALSDARVVEVKVDVDESDIVAQLTNLQVEVQIAVQPSG